MDNKKYFTKIRKIVVMILISSMVCIFLFSMVPLVAEKIFSDSDDFNKLVPAEFSNELLQEEGTISFTELYTFYSLKKRGYEYEKYDLSENQEIRNLSDQTNLEYIIFWVIFLTSLVLYIGVILNIAKKYIRLSQFIMLIGCLITLFNFILIFSHIRFIDTINSYDYISLAFVFSPEIPFTYYYLVIIANIILLISSILYTVYTLPFIIKQIKIHKNYNIEQSKISAIPLEKDIQEPIKNPDININPILKEKTLLTESKKSEKIKQKWIKELQNQKNIKKIDSESEFKRIIRDTPDYQKPNQKIQENISTDSNQKELTEDFFEFDNYEKNEKVENEKKLLNKTKSTDNAFFEKVEEKPNIKIKKEIPKSKKYKVEPFKSKKESFTSSENKESLNSTDNTFEKTLFSAIDKKKKLRKK